MSELRRRLAAAGIELHVVKNTLLRIASERAQYQDLSQILNGQTTIALSYEDEVAPAKTLADYLRQGKTGKPRQVKAATLARGPISATEGDARAKVTPSEH